VGLEAIRGVKTVNEIGQEYGVHPAQVGQWKKEILEGAETLFGEKRGPKPVDGPGDTERLYGEIGRLKDGLDRAPCLCLVPRRVEDHRGRGPRRRPQRRTHQPRHLRVPARAELQ
jgi:hypothetical protein